MEYKLWSITFCNFRRILYLLYFSGILVSSLLFCMDVELRLLHCRNKIGWGSSRRGWWERNFWPDRQEVRKSCRKFPYNEQLNYFYSSPNIISFFLSQSDLFYPLFAGLPLRLITLIDTKGSSQRPLRNSTQHSRETDIHAPGGIRTRNPGKRVTTDPCLRPCGHRNRLNITTVTKWSKLHGLCIWHAWERRKIPTEF